MSGPRMADSINGLDEIALVEAAENFLRWWRDGGRVGDTRDAIEPVIVAAALLASDKPGLDENPCCYSLHEFEQVCPRTGTTFRLSGGGAALLASDKPGRDVERLARALHAFYAGKDTRDEFFPPDCTHREDARIIAVAYAADDPNAAIAAEYERLSGGGSNDDGG